MFHSLKMRSHLSPCLMDSEAKNLLSAVAQKPPSRFFASPFGPGCSVLKPRWHFGPGPSILASHVLSINTCWRLTWKGSAGRVPAIFPSLALLPRGLYPSYVYHSLPRGQPRLTMQLRSRNALKGCGLPVLSSFGVWKAFFIFRFAVAVLGVSAEDPAENFT